jgi:hypothetical protein
VVPTERGGLVWKLDDDHALVLLPLPPGPRSVVREALVSSKRFDRVLARFQRGHVGLILGMMKAGVDEGAVDDGIPLPLLLAASFGVMGFPQIVRRVAGASAPFASLPDARRTATIAVDTLFRGIAPRRQRKRKARRAR